MKLTKNTIPQIKDYQCDKYKAIKCHKNMHDDNWCYDCFDETEKLAKELSADLRPFTNNSKVFKQGEVK